MIRQVFKNRIGTLTTISNGTSYSSFYSATQVSCQQARGALDWPTSPEAQERRACSRAKGVMMWICLTRALLAPHRKLGVWTSWAWASFLREVALRGVSFELAIPLDATASSPHPSRRCSSSFGCEKMLAGGTMTDDSPVVDVTGTRTEL